MKFRSKLFLALFASALVSAIGASLFVYFELRDRLWTEYLDRYETLMEMTGTALINTEKSSELIGRNALYYFREIVEESGMPKTEAMSALATKLNVSHFYATDQTGEFIRSTETPLDVVDKGLFDFCPGYKKLLTNPGMIERTPILPSYPFRGPYKFMMSASKDQQYILEVGIHLEFIGATLNKVISSDTNIRSMGFYTPSGFNLGEIKSDGKFSEGGNISLKETKEGMTRTADDNLILMQKIPAAVQNCCECKTKNIVGGDEGYFYWLKTNISTKPFQATMASIREKVLLLLFAIFLIGFFLSKKITSKLTSRLDQVSAAMDKVTNEEDLSTRLNFKGKDEIADIGRRFDGMVEALSESRSKQLEAERHRSFSEMARRVGHDIKSPIAALNTAVQSDQTLSEQSRILVRGAISRIREITSGLYSRPHLSTADQFSYQSIDDHVTGETQVFALGPIVEAICDEKRANLFNRPSLSIDLDMENNGYGIFGRINSSEFKRVISSLLDNSVEAMDKMAGHIEIKISRKKGKIQISISDDGNGIPENIKSKVFHRGFTYGKKEGSGLGLYYAKKVIESWGGNLTLDSEIRTGTEITIKLPEPKPPLWYVDQISTQGVKKIIVIDDDQTIHTVWEQIFKNIDTKISLEHFYGFKEAEQWLNAMELGGEALSEVLLLSDFEIRNEIENGFEFLKRRKLFDRSILVTSYSDDQKLIARCLKLGCKMIPKNLAAHVPIKLDG